MSNNSPNHFASEYESSVIHFYQQKMQRLRGTVRHRNMATANAKDLTFFRMGTSTATERARGASLTAQNQEMPTAVVTPVEIDALNWIDRQDVKRMTYDSRDAFAMSQAAALARKADGQIIAAAEAGEALAVAAGRPALDFSAAYADLSHLTLIEAQMGERDVPEDGLLTVLVSPSVFNNWLLFPAFNSSDWVGYTGISLPDKTRAVGKFWNGMNIIKHTGLTNTGYSLSTDTVDCIAYHQSSIGHASISDITVETANTLADNRPGTNVNSFFDAGAIPIDFNGIQVFTMKNHITA